MLFKAVIEESALDFIRGAGSEASQQIRQSKLGQAVGSVVKAGQTESKIGDFVQKVNNFYQLILQYQNLKRRNLAGPAPAHDERLEPTMQPATGAQQNATSQQTNMSSDPAPAFRTTNKPRMRPNARGDAEYMFNSFTQKHSGDKLDEGIMDFIKGAGRAVGTKIADKVNNYSDRPSFLKDVVQAGRQRSAEGNIRRINDQMHNVYGKARAALDDVVQALRDLPQDKRKFALDKAAVKVAGTTRASWLTKTIADEYRAKAKSDTTP